MNSIQPKNRSFLLQTLCESNYRKLLKLIPTLKDIDCLTIGQAADKPKLFLMPIEIGPYTTTLELSYRFDDDVERLFEPAVKMRVYFDARSVEVLRDNERPMVKQALNKSATATEIMNYKWELNYFLEKWLNHCIKDNYRFESREKNQSRIIA